MNRWVERGCLGAVVLCAAYFGLGVILARSTQDVPVLAFDLYNFFYPNVLYALASLREGEGLLWNPYQNCGQPFFADSLVGLLYPGHWIFALLRREPALIASMVLHLAIAGVGAYRLGREIRLGAAAALCGALAFQLSGSALHLAAWSPMHIAPYAWLPVAMLFAERLIRSPTRGAGLALGVVLTLQLLPGFPQIVVFTYQLIVLRFLWAAVTRERAGLARSAFPLAVGLALPFFLAAVQLLPSAEMARESLRGMALAAPEMEDSVIWAAFRRVAASATFPGAVVSAVVPALAFASLAAPGLRRAAVFYGGIAIAYFVLSLGPGTPLFDVYAELPLGRLFRGPIRFLFVASFGVAIATAIGVEAILGAARGRSVAGRALPPALLLAGIAVFALVFPAGVDPVFWPVAAAALVGAVLAAFAPKAVGVAGALLAVCVWASFMVGVRPLHDHRAGDLYHRNAEAFERVKERLTSQDRVFIAGRHRDFALTEKSASIFRVPGVHDYQPQVSRAFAEFFVRMVRDDDLRVLNDWLLAARGGWIKPGRFQRRLLDLTGARQLMVHPSQDTVAATFGSDAEPWIDTGAVRVYENPDALPRARYVPRIAVYPEDRILFRLADPSLDLRTTALVSPAPASGFRGEGPDASGTAQIVSDRPERVVVQVDAPARGFLVLADQHYPGWTARVDGAPAEILRANHVFRAVEVPAGVSEVEFRYQPASVRLGAAISLAAWIALVVAVARSRRFSAA